MNCCLSSLEPEPCWWDTPTFRDAYDGVKLGAKWRLPERAVELRMPHNYVALMTGTLETSLLTSSGILISGHRSAVSLAEPSCGCNTYLAR